MTIIGYVPPDFERIDDPTLSDIKRAIRTVEACVAESTLERRSHTEAASGPPFVF